nr:MAG TPA: deoxyuridine 5'-triphosphate nucleotidohydrolase [Caudoviricetes sp.]
MELKFKKLHKDAVLPKYAYPNETNGLDLVAVEVTETEDYIEYNTGIAVEIEPGFMGALLPNSRISKYDLIMCNAPGDIDPGYRGPIRVRFKKVYNLPTLFQRFCQSVIGVIANVLGNFVEFKNQNIQYKVKTYEIGDVVAQLVIIPAPVVTPIFVDELKPSMRDTGGFGSTKELGNEKHADTQSGEAR